MYPSLDPLRGENPPGLIEAGRRCRPGNSAWRPLRGENPPGLIEAGDGVSRGAGFDGHSGGRIPPASLKRRRRADPRGRGPHSGGRIPPASLKRSLDPPAGAHRPLRGENPPGLIEAGGSGADRRPLRRHSGGRIPPASLKRCRVGAEAGPVAHSGGRIPPASLKPLPAPCPRRERSTTPGGESPRPH